MHNTFEMMVRFLEVLNEYEKRGKIGVSNELVKMMVDQTINHYNAALAIVPPEDQPKQQLPPKQQEPQKMHKNQKTNDAESRKK